MSRYLNIIDSTVKRVGQFSAWLIFVLVMVVSLDVILRTVFNSSNPAIFEFEWHLFAAIFLLGSAYTLQKDKHVRVDLIYNRLGTKKRRVIDLIGVLLFLFPFCYVGLSTSIAPVLESWYIGESSPDPGGLPYRFVIKSMVPISFLLVLVQGVSIAIRHILTLTTR